MSGKKKGQKLKITGLTSVDLCGKGANPDADICLYKSATGNTVTEPTPPASTSDDAEKSILKRIAEAMCSALGMSVPIPAEAVVKDAQTFNGITAIQEVNDNLWKYIRAFEESVNSIVRDDEKDASEKSTLLNETLEQFSTTMQALFPTFIGVTKNDEPGVLEKSTTEGDDNDMKFADLDTSALTAEEKATFEALAKKCPVTEPAPAAEPAAQVTEPAADPAPVGKSATEPAAEPAKETDPAITKALQELDELKKSYSGLIEQQEKAQELDVAKKYIPLGKKPEELADTLYSLKKSGKENYDAFVAALDANLDLVNKSGLFGEIGKSTHGDEGSDAEAKLASIAKTYREADPNLTWNEAMVKACDENPELRAEYEKY